jgi:hypothetical protein
VDYVANEEADAYEYRAKNDNSVDCDANLLEPTGLFYFHARVFKRSTVPSDVDNAHRIARRPSTGLSLHFMTGLFYRKELHAALKGRKAAAQVARSLPLPSQISRNLASRDSKFPNGMILG